MSDMVMNSDSPLELAKLFEGRDVLVLGGTGFLGKIVVSMLLAGCPNLGRMFLVVRSGKGLTSDQRFWRSIATSDTFEPLRKAHGDDYEAFLRRVVVPVDGDLGRPNCGISSAVVDELRGKLAAVVNVAGVVDFYPPLDEAVDANALGTKNLIELAKSLGDAPLFHTSTCYVSAGRKGAVREEDPRLHPFPRANELDKASWDPAREIEECLATIASERARSRDAVRTSEAEERARKALLARHEPTKGSAFEAEVERQITKALRDRLVEAGMARAAHWGWPNIYTYTKSIGEQLVAGSGLAWTIARPACCESTVEFPCVGYNEGISTSAPQTYLMLRAPVSVPARPVPLDFIPSDYVAGGMIAALGELVAGQSRGVYQMGTSDVNPATSQRIGELNGLYRRKSLTNKATGNPLANRLQAQLEPYFLTPEKYESQGEPAKAAFAKGVASFLRSAIAAVPVAPGIARGAVKSAASSLDSFAKGQEKIAMIMRLYEPFTSRMNGPFHCANTRAAHARLVPRERKAFPWAPEALDWAKYLHEVHIPALEKRVFPELDRKLARELKPLARYDSLVALVDELATRHGHAPALEVHGPSETTRVTYVELSARIRAAARRLVKAGVQKGDRVLLGGKNAPSWVVDYFGIVMAGAVAVPVDPALEADPMLNVARASNARAAVFDEALVARLAEQVGATTEGLPALEALEAMGVRIFDAAALAEHAGPRAMHTTREISNTTTHWAKLADVKPAVAPEHAGREAREKHAHHAHHAHHVNGVSHAKHAAHAAHRAEVIEVDGFSDDDEILLAREPSGDDLASLLFTSGTTSAPKGVKLTHKNFTSMVAALAPLFPLKETDRILSVLPLHHTFEFTCGLLLPLTRGARVGYVDEVSGERIGHALKTGRITGMVGVPALFEALERKVRNEAAAKGEVAEKFVDVGTELARRASEATGVDFGALLFSPVRAALGGNLKHLISGGAAMPEGTRKFFSALGLHLAEGYGLTEASPVLTVADARTRSKHKGVGKPVPGVEIRIGSPDERGVGEVLARGPNVMAGYTSDEETARVLDADGWLKTGDLGKLDSRGRLVLAGRSKDVIVGANGENVYPDDVEAKLGVVDGVAELAVVGVPGRGSATAERVACLAVVEGALGLPSEERAQRFDRARQSLRVAIAKLPFGEQPTVVHLQDAALVRTATRKVKRPDVRAIVLRNLEAIEQPRGSDAAPDSSGQPAVSEARRAIARLRRMEVGDVHAHSSLRGDLGFDSLAVAELAAVLEARGRAVDVTALAACNTVEEVERLARLGPSSVRASAPKVKEPPVVSLPEPLRDLGKRAIGRAQDAFYGRAMDVRVFGRSNIPYNRNAIVVANHASHLDMGLVRHALGTYGEDIVTLAAQDYFFEHPASRAVFENLTNLVALDRNGSLRESMRVAGDLLSRGKTVLVFPEGTRAERGAGGEVAEFKALAFQLALAHKVDILPVHLGGTAQAMPKGAALPARKPLTARIGIPLGHADLAKITQGMSTADAAREVARVAREAVVAAGEGRPFEIASRAAALGAGSGAGALPVKKTRERKHPIAALFEDLETRFVRDAAERELSYYITLGDEPHSKWTVRVGPAACAIYRGKPNGGAADCVLKTSPELFEKIVRDAYMPGPSDFLTGAVKSNDVAILAKFGAVFRLG